jgi:hypothetical protein
MHVRQRLNSSVGPGTTNIDKRKELTNFTRRNVIYVDKIHFLPYDLKKKLKISPLILKKD